MRAVPKPDDVFHAVHLKEMKVFVHTKTDVVLLRARTGADDIWFSLARSDFIELARYLANDAVEMTVSN
jgi:hypothetical protein